MDIKTMKFMEYAAYLDLETAKNWINYCEKKAIEPKRKARLFHRQTLEDLQPPKIHLRAWRYIMLLRQRDLWKWKMEVLKYERSNR